MDEYKNERTKLFEYKTNKRYFPRDQELLSCLIIPFFSLFSLMHQQRLLPIVVKFSDSAHWQPKFYRSGNRKVAMPL